MTEQCSKCNVFVYTSTFEVKHITVFVFPRIKVIVLVVIFLWYFNFLARIDDFIIVNSDIVTRRSEVNPNIYNRKKLNAIVSAK